MKQFKFPHIGMRTTKTAVAVMLSYLIFVPFGLLYNESYPGVLAYVGPTYSCIACIVCMQSSLEQTLQVGLSRFVGVFIGAILGVAPPGADRRRKDRSQACRRFGKSYFNA